MNAEEKGAPVVNGCCWLCPKGIPVRLDGSPGTGGGEPAPNIPLPSPVAMEALKGFAEPPPVIWGRRPTPRVDVFPAFCMSEAPKAEVGLKPPVRPVGWELSGD